MIHATHIHSAPGSREQEYLEGWQRARAELDNFRKRIAAEDEAQRMRMKRELVESFLALADHFQSLAKHIPRELKGHAWADGVLHVARQFEQALREFQVVPIDAADTVFDPTRHEAVEQVKKKGVKKGLVVEVLQPGYVIGDTVVRPAKVKVAA